MPAAVVSTNHVAAGSATAISFTSLAVTSGQTVFVYLTGRDGTGANYASSTWNAVNQPADESVNGTVAAGIQFHRLIFRGLSGTQTLAITLSAFLDDLEGWALVMSDVDQTTSMGAADSDDSDTTGTADPARITVAGTANDIVISTMRIRADLVSTLAVEGGQTLLDGPQLTGNGNSIILSSEAGAASVTSGYTFDDSGFPTWAIDGVVIQGVAAAGAAPRTLLLLGVG